MLRKCDRRELDRTGSESHSKTISNISSFGPLVCITNWTLDLQYARDLKSELRRYFTSINSLESTYIPTKSVFVDNINAKTILRPISVPCFIAFLLAHQSKQSSSYLCLTLQSLFRPQKSVSSVSLLRDHKIPWQLQPREFTHLICRVSQRYPVCIIPMQNVVWLHA